nr:hypothetical protein [uncultured Draconibacterium sp.]
MLKELLLQTGASGAKSTILKPLSWIISILIIGIVLLVQVQGPRWSIAAGAICVGICILLYLATYIYCLFTDKDAIRSEKFSIQKMAIEKGVYGDSNAGILGSSTRSEDSMLGVSSKKEDK